MGCAIHVVPVQGHVEGALLDGDAKSGGFGGRVRAVLGAGRTGSGQRHRQGCRQRKKQGRQAEQWPPAWKGGRNREPHAVTSRRRWARGSGKSGLGQGELGGATSATMTLPTEDTANAAIPSAAATSSQAPECSRAKSMKKSLDFNADRGNRTLPHWSFLPNNHCYELL